MSLQLFTGANISKKLQSNDLIAIESATISVKDLQGVLVSLFQDKSGNTPQVNPFIADDTGQFFFYVQPGFYSLSVTKGAIIGTIFIEIGLSGVVTPVDVETDALVVTEDDHGNLFNISDLTGSVSVTLEAVTTNGIGAIVFFKSKTDSPIQFVAGAGVTIETAYSLNIHAKFSMCAAVWESETIVTLTGDLEQ